MLWTLYELGRWDELVRIADELLDGPQRVISGDLAGGGALTYHGLVNLRRGEARVARQPLLAFLPRGREIGEPQVLAPALAVAALAEHACGNTTAALSSIPRIRALWRAR